MSIKHLEYLKVKDSKLLVVEVRPIKCLLDSPSGPIYTDKWMEYSHWKELHHHLLEVVEEYEEQRAALNVECNKPKCKTGRTLQIGYMLRPLPSCFCSLYFLTPRNNQSWTDDGNDSGYLQDKGGCFEDLVACGEMLVVSVTLRDLAGSSSQSSFSQNSSNSQQQPNATSRLMKALGSKMMPTISDYFKFPEDNDSCVSVRDASSSKGVLASESKEKMSSIGVNTPGRLQKENESGTVGESVDGSRYHTDVNAPTPVCFTEVDSNPPEERINKKYGQFHHKVDVKKTQIPKKTGSVLTNLKQTSLLDFRKKSCTNLSDLEIKLRKVCVPIVKVNKKVPVHGNLKGNSGTSEGENVQKTKENFRSFSYKALPHSLNVNGSESDSDEVRYYEGDVSRDLSFEPQKKNVECEGQGMDGLGNREVFISTEENRMDNVLFSASVSERREADNVEVSALPQTDPLGSEALQEITRQFKENTLTNVDSCEQCKLLDKLSPLISRVSSENTSEALLCNSDVSPSNIVQENINADTVFLGVCETKTRAEDKSFFVNDTEYEQQNYFKNDVESCSSSSQYTARNIQSDVEETDELIVHKIKEECVESEHNSHEYLHSSKEDEYDVLNRIQHNQDGIMCSSKREHNGNEEPHEDSRISAEVRKMHSPTQDKTKTKMHKIPLQESLMSPANSHGMSVQIKTEEDDTAGLLISSNHTDSQSNKPGKGASQVSICDESANCEKEVQETRPSKVTVEYVKSCPEIILQIHGQEHSVLKAPAPGCQNSCQLRKKHSREKVSHRKFKNVNLVTTPDVRYSSTGIKYPSQTKESLHSARGAATEGNEKNHDTESFSFQAEEESRQKLESNRATSPIKYAPSCVEYLSGTNKSSCSAKDFMIKGSEEAHSTQLFENKCSFSSKERIEHMARSQVASDQSCQRQLVDANDMFVAWYRSQNVSSQLQPSSDEFLLQNSSGESSFVNVETLSTNESQSPSQISDQLSVMREDPLQHNVYHSTEEGNVVTFLRSMKIVHLGCKKDYEGSSFGSECSKRKQLFTDFLPVDNTALYFSSGSDAAHILEQENHTPKLLPDCLIPECRQTHKKKRKNVNKAASVCKKKRASKIGKKKKGQSNISSFLNTQKSVCSGNVCGKSNQGVQGKNLTVKFSQNGGRYEAGLDVSDEEYTFEKICTKGMKKNQREFSSPEVPTSTISHFEANEQLFMSKKSKILAKDLEESEDSSGESSGKYTSYVSSETDHVSNSVCTEDLNVKFVNDKQERNLRRSTRKKGISSQPKIFDDYSESNYSPQLKRFKQNAHKFATKGKERKNTLKNKKMDKILKTRSPVKKSKVVVQNKNTYKESRCESDENENESDMVIHKNKAHQSAHKTQKVVSKSSTSKQFKDSLSKQTEITKIQDWQVKSDSDYCNDLWNFSLDGDNDKQVKQTGYSRKPYNKKYSYKNCQKASTSRNVTGEKEKKKYIRKRNSTVDMKNVAPDSIDDDFFMKIQAEVEQLNAIALKDVEDTSVVSETSSSRNNSTRMRNGKKSCEKECQITTVLEGSNYTLDSLRRSYRKLQNMTNSDLEQRLEENLSYLEDVIMGVLPNERHQWFKQSNPDLMLQQDYLIYGPFTSDQSLFVLELLKKKLGHMDRFIGNSYDVPVYRCRVLVPTFFTKIVMDNESVTLDEAYKLMAKFSLNKNIAVDLQQSESKKFSNLEP